MDVQITSPSEDSTVLANQENQRRQMVREALEWFHKSGAVLENGHFKFGHRRNEMHGRMYVNPRRLFNMAFVAKYMTQALVDVLPTEIRLTVEIVAGPPSCGIVVARDLADFISTRRETRKGPQLPNVEALFFAKDPDNLFALHESDKERVRGKKVLVVDDVRHRGQTFSACVSALLEAGAIVLATAELIDRKTSTLSWGVPNYFVGQIETESLYRPDVCPMCKAGIPITKF